MSKIVSPPVTRPNGRKVFAFRNMAWIDSHPEQSKTRIRDVERLGGKRIPSFMDLDAGEKVPKLLITPNAQGHLKPPMFSQLHSNLAIMSMDHEMEPWCENNGYDMMGFYIVEVQAYSPDATHLSTKGCLGGC